MQDNLLTLLHWILRLHFCIERSVWVMVINCDTEHRYESYINRGNLLTKHVESWSILQLNFVGAIGLMTMPSGASSCSVLVTATSINPKLNRCARMKHVVFKNWFNRVELSLTAERPSLVCSFCVHS